MKNLFFATMLLLVLPLHLVAQDDDDMYFVPQKSSKAKRTITVIYDDFDTDDSEGNTDCHVGKLRDIDEYNRRGYGAQGSGKVYGEVYANNDTLYITEQDLQERSRDIYADDDYSCCNRIVRFHGGIRNPYYWDYYYDWAYDPWYYDPWYFGPRYIVWGGPWYYDPWYRHGWIGWHSWGWGGYRPGHHHGYHPGGYYYSSHRYRPGDGIALGRTGGRSMASGSNRFGGISSQRGTHTTQYGSGPSRNTGNRSYVTGTGVRGGGSTTTSRTTGVSSTGVSSSRGTRSYSTPSSSSSTRSYSTPSSSSGSVRSGSSLGSSSPGGGGFSGGGRGGSSSGGGFGSRGGGRGR
ncbi:MAG: hypothetical protein KBT12_08675 [Bacteroidales bacterium]|nr:hypothetical protein [Candidatus Physcousia equi]